MSFQRPGGPVKKKKFPSKKKPVWDDSVHDLTVYRATPSEVISRKEAHKSKNHIMSVKLEKMRTDEQQPNLSGADLQKLAIMKEVLYDKSQLQKVLAKSDAMMAVVKDLFGDDPKRSIGFPNVTTAPESESVSSSLVKPVPDIYTRSEKLSDSVMNQSAINDMEDSDSDVDDETERPEPISYQSKLNLQHFHEYLQEEERNGDHRNPQTLIAQQSTKAISRAPINPHDDLEEARIKHMISLLEQAKLNPQWLTQNPQQLSMLLANLTSPQSKPGFRTPPRNKQIPPPNESLPSAINDTQKVKRTRKQISSPQSAQENTSVNISDMRQALKDLESELGSYEHQTGRLCKEDVNKNESCSGYTVALVSAVSRLTKYLKETDLRVRTEVTLREQLTQDVYQLRAIIDALASDLIMTQEEYAKLYSENQRYKETTASELATMNRKIVELQTIICAHLPATLSNGLTSLQAHRENTVNSSRRSEESRTSTPNQNNSAQSQGHDGPSSSAAVLLSPVVRKTRVLSNNNASGMPPKKQTSLVDMSDLAVSNSSNADDPPQLTQAPPVMKSISVPRPISLVQSNLPVPLTSSLPTSTTVTESIGHDVSQEGDAAKLVKLGDQSQKQLQFLKELTTEEVLQDPALQDLMQTQIAELNRQQEEAKKRLRDLLANQKLQQQQLQEHLGPDVDLDRDFSPHGHWGQNQSEEQTISPPISPISSMSDRPALRDMENLPQIPLTRGITLTLPKADLDVSAGSLSTPPRSQGLRTDD